MKKLDIKRLKDLYSERKEMRKILIIAPLLGLLSVILIHDIFADVYKYVDKNGTVCFTDSIQAVPKDYRKKAEIVSVQPKKEKGQQSEAAIQTTENKGPRATVLSTEKEEEAKENIKEAIKGFVSNRLFKLIAGLIGFLFIFIIIGKASNFLGHKRVGSILRIALTLLVLLYLFNSHLKEVVNVFAMLKEEVLGVKKQAEERNKETDKIINELSGEPQSK